MRYVTSADAAAQIESGGIFEVIVKEAVDIFYHRTSLLAEFKAATAAWKAGEYAMFFYFYL